MFIINDQMGIYIDNKLGFYLTTLQPQLSFGCLFCDFKEYYSFLNYVANMVVETMFQEWILSPNR